MADYNPYAILAAGMPAALQGFQTLANGSMEVARYNRAQADNERLRKDMQAERIAELDRMDRRQVAHESAIHLRNRAERDKDQLDAAKVAYASAGGDIGKASSMSLEQLSAETAKLARLNALKHIGEMSDAQIRATAKAVGIDGADTKPLGEISDALATHAVEQGVKAKLDERKMIEDFASKDPNVQEAISTASKTIALAQAARAKALNPSGLEALRADQRKRIQDAIAQSPEVSAALRKLFPNDSDYNPRMHAVAVGNYNAAVAGLDGKSVDLINSAMNAASQNATLQFQKSGLADEANWFRQYNAGIRSADANFAKTLDAVRSVYGHDPVYGPIIMRKALNGIPLLQVQGDGQQDQQSPAPASLFPNAPQGSMGGGGFVPSIFSHQSQSAPDELGVDLMPPPAGGYPSKLPLIPPPAPIPGSDLYDNHGVSFTTE